ncbi:GumC family protein [uncultured Roseibium sp.]|uniref:GumC family protein n=1 Tax=uncultured Roseibium sp. TaxID=1936171 RepID=UPI003217A121
MIEISHLPGLLRRHLFWLIVTPAVFMALALVYVVLKTPVYRSTAVLLVEPQGLQIQTVRQNGTGPAPAIQSLQIDSQAYVILSAAVLNDVADKLNLDDNPIFNQTGLLSGLLGKPANMQSQTEKRAALIVALREMIQVTRLSGSFVFQIRASTPSPSLAAQIANETANSYIAQTRFSRNETLARAGSSFSKQASELRARLDKAETAVETYKAKHGLISTGSGGLVVDQQIQALNTQIAQAKLELEKAKTAYLLAEPMTAADVEGGLIPQTGESTVLSTLRLEHSRIAQQRAEAATTLGANHPKLKELSSQLANTQLQIQNELQRLKNALKNTYEQAKGTLSALEQQSQALQSENSVQGKALIELRQLQSEADASRAIYEAFLQRSKELEEQPKIDADGSQVLSEAQVPTAPSGPRKIIVLVAAGAFGFAVAAAVIVGLALLSGQITSERELATRTGVPILSLIPSDHSSSFDGLVKLVPWLARRAANDETERSLALTRVAYRLRQTFENARPITILVLSTKSDLDIGSLTRQIALQLHEMGERVLLANGSNAKSDAKNTKPRTFIKAGKKGKRDSRVELLAKMAVVAGEYSAGGRLAEAGQDGSRLSSYLSVERIDDHRNYASYASVAEGADDFLIIECGSASDSPILPVLLKHSDGIVLVSEIGETNFRDLDRTLAYLEPWHDRVIGNVVLSSA